jgi:hypothetical protein
VTLGFDEADVSKRIGKLGDMMSRRHLIVHRSDREEANVDDAGGKKKSHGLPRKIDVATVTGWLNDVRALVEYVIEHIDAPPKPKKNVGRRAKLKG